MFCEKCGTQNPDHAAFCENCGSPLPKEAVLQRQQEEVQSPAGQPEPVQPSAYQQPVKAPKTPRKPMPAGAKIAIIAAIAVVVLGAAGFMLLKSFASPKRLVESYADAYTAHDSDKIFDLLCFEKSDFITPDALKSSLESRGDEYTGMTEYTIEEDTEEEDDNTLYYTVVFRDKSNSTQYAEFVTLERSDNKRFLFFDNWKMKTTGYVVKNYTISVPSGINAKVKVNDISLDDSYKGDEDGTYVIPSCFPGTYTLSLESDFYEPYKTQFTVTEGDGGDEDYCNLSVNDQDLNISSSIEKSLGTMAAETVTDLYIGAVEEKNFSDIVDADAVDSECDLETQYNNWINDNVKSDTCITGLEITNTQTTLGGLDYEDDTVRASVAVEMTYNTTSSVRDYWSGKSEKRSNEGKTGTCTLYYEYRDGSWIIYAYDNFSYAIDYEKY